MVHLIKWESAQLRTDLKLNAVYALCSQCAYSTNGSPFTRYLRPTKTSGICSPLQLFIYIALPVYGSCVEDEQSAFEKNANANHCSLCCISSAQLASDCQCTHKQARYARRLLVCTGSKPCSLRKTNKRSRENRAILLTHSRLSGHY